jgi:hypothetical protein
MLAWIGLIFYMSIGLVMFEWAWARMKPVREVNEERDS